MTEVAVLKRQRTKDEFIFFLQIFNWPGIVFVSSSIFIGFIIGKGNLSKSIYKAQIIAIPVGLSGTLIGCITVLDSLSKPDAIKSELSRALLCLFYGGILWLILRAVSNRTGTHEPSSKTTQLRVKIAVFFWLSAIVLSGLANKSLIFLIYPHAKLLFVGIIFFLIMIGGHNKQKTVEKISYYSSRVAALTALFCCCVILDFNGDQTKIGPAMAVGLHFLLYSCIIMVTARTIREPVNDRSKGGDKFGLPILLSSSLFFVLISNLLYHDLESNWKVQLRMDGLDRGYTEQGRLLRRLAPKSPAPEGNLLTVSTDRKAWIFVDGILEGQAPLYQYERTKEQHTVQVATCPNGTGMMNNSEEVSFEEYWHTASDGSCETPTEEEIQELIKSGKITTHLISKSDEIEQFELQWGPEINLCCDEGTTKEFAVSSKQGHLIYDWSFEEQAWHSHPESTTPLPLDP